MKRLLILCLVPLWLLVGCGDDGGDATSTAERDPEFATELLHRDAALLNLLDVSLGRSLPAGVAQTSEQLRIDVNERMGTTIETLEQWGEKVPLTSRDHGAEHSSDNDIPDLAGMPTGDDLQRIAKLNGQRFVEEYVALLASTLEATKAFAEDQAAQDRAADRLAESAVASSQAGLDAL